MLSQCPNVHHLVKRLYRSHLRQRPLPTEILARQGRIVAVCLLDPILETQEKTCSVTKVWDALRLMKKEFEEDEALDGILPPASEVEALRAIPLMLILANARLSHHSSQRQVQEDQECLEHLLSMWKELYDNWQEPFLKFCKRPAPIVGSATSLSMSTIRRLSQFCENCGEKDLTFTLSSGTPNEVDTATYIFITPAVTKSLTAGATQSDQSISPSTKRTRTTSPDECLLESTDGFGNEKFFTAETSQKKTSTTGCNISVNRPEGSYTWKAECWKAGTYFIDLKVYSDVRAYKAANWKEAWRLADIRAKTTLGSPLQPARNAEIKKVLDQLTNLILQEAEEYPNVEKNHHPKS